MNPAARASSVRRRETMHDLEPMGETISDDTGPHDGSLRVMVANETHAVIDAQRIESAVEAALSDSPYTEVSVSVAIVDDQAIHELNRQFLGHDYPTDVLSFPLEDASPRLEGEIVVSADTAERCALEAGWRPEDELLLYVVHGALHLAGFEDKEPSDAEEMRARERAVLAQLGIEISAQDSRWRPADQEEKPS
jgi:probable rRNA maturation factor